ncbi:MAG: Ribonuclease H [uncultured bacterium]|uniref:Ribonuclease H n=1 Tax=Candidatus Uhrbacteria bacterium GW2011_GWC1_41_20 TaxID=1618983 RepID=A0A0G0XQA4_9BACT|nr:MAG: Ribonuclease H [uncultured bacterium]KKR22519.1 MAG: Ribonuclease H [Candidatus Uhrbacteria bacterium GW2011_GWE1_39_46]KKR63866.1 MAG: Ribonuclease H [Candidatus Uhrbacteria bacterium GW2011_GWC2_40_450]KKR90062.1 MAG: Ribonuclease H [Candidatus Uhrbacteria bacterium GW2011_GWD2_41_121]KKR90214.1 MAG: Ribonuclease H [Candidatus Uhrbacteria bacterium GW2011_GWE2_41_1153]KKR96022.1 MAG: Ribonuclease H [Candidatus Uhrbacteria bacterium GW2011_GWD1_41_16]KKR99035.1 MAG: Ribonuclease H [C
MHVRLYTDGGARGNPGPSGAGFVIYALNDQDQEAEKIFADGKYLGDATNNIAEYEAVILGLTKALELNASSVDLVMDSELIVKQLNGEYKVKNEGLAQKYLQVHNLLYRFERVTFRHVRREFNKEADAQVNKALDKALGVV